MLAGFPDGLAHEGVSAGPATLAGLRLAHELGQTAPGDEPASDGVQRWQGDDAAPPAAIG